MASVRKERTIMLKKLSIIFVVYMMIVSGSFSKVNADSYGQYEYTVTNNEATITSYMGREKDVKIPSEINGYKVTGITGEFASMNRDSVVLPSTLKEIKIQKEAVDPEDVEMLQDLILSCVNEALRKVDSAQAQELGKYNIPGLM